VASLSTTPDELAGTFEPVDADVSDLEGAMPEYDIDERLDDLTGDLEDVEAFVDNLRAAFD